MKCLNCGNELAEGIKFCSECGTPVPKNKFCINCGTKLVPEAKFCPECGTKQQVENTVKNQQSEVVKAKDELRETINKETNASDNKKADIDISKIKHSGLWLIKLSSSGSAHYHIFQITKYSTTKKITLVKMVKEIGNMGLADAKQYVEGSNSDNPLTIVVDNTYTKCIEYNQVKEFCSSDCEYNYVDLGSSCKIAFLDNSISVNNDGAIFNANPAKKLMRVSHDVCEHDYIDF